MLTNPADLDIAQVATDLNVALGRVVRRLRQTHVPGDLTLSEASVLARLDRAGPATPTDLADSERVRPQAMSATLAALEARRLLARAGDPRDGRRALISITDAGRTALGNRRDAKVAAVAAAITSSLSDDEIVHLHAATALLQRLADKL